MLRSLLSFEGISLIVLIFVAVPLKYLFSFPLAVLLVGSLHGFLFAGVIFLLAKNLYEENITFYQAFIFFFLALIPFGNIYSCRQIDMIIDGWAR